MLLQEVGLDARFVPLSAFAAPSPADARADALVVFSQGLSPNARLALHDVERWAGVLLVTAVPARDAPQSAPPADASPAGPLAERQALLDDLVGRGVVVQRIPASEEYGTLLRVSGPMTGYAAAITLARAVAEAAGRAAAGLLPAALPIDDVCACVAGAAARLAHEHADLDAAALEERSRLPRVGGLRRRAREPARQGPRRDAAARAAGLGSARVRARTVPADRSPSA